MKIGFPLWYGQGGGISRLIHEAERSGFDYFELSLDYPWPFRGKPRIDDVVREIVDRSFSLAFHAPWRDIRLASPFDEVRSSSVKVVKDFINRVAEYASDYVVLHVSTDQAVDRIHEVAEESVEAAVSSLIELEDFARSFGLRIVAENVREDLRAFEKIVSKSGVEVCLDVSHAICSAARRGGRGRIEKVVEDWVSSLKERVRVIHFSGVRFLDNRVEDHYTVSEDDRFLKLVKKKLPLMSVENFLLECFKNPSGEEATPSMLSSIVKLLKK